MANIKSAKIRNQTKKKEALKKNELLRVEMNVRTHTNQNEVTSSKPSQAKMLENHFLCCTYKTAHINKQWIMRENKREKGTHTERVRERQCEIILFINTDFFVVVANSVFSRFFFILCLCVCRRCLVVRMQWFLHFVVFYYAAAVAFFHSLHFQFLNSIHALYYVIQLFKKT